jgi:hypothetical protein
MKLMRSCSKVSRFAAAVATAKCGAHDAQRSGGRTAGRISTFYARKAYPGPATCAAKPVVRLSR